VDRWDCVGIAGAALIGGGLWALSNPAWAAIFWGALLMALYIAREIRAPRR
jgi:uncharacterized membrane protein HdeD (DUF308 family)